jgi:hypothetical protein
MRSPTKLKENKSDTGAIIAIVRHNAHEWLAKHKDKSFQEIIPPMQRKQGYRPEQWARKVRVGGKMSKAYRK